MYNSELVSLFKGQTAVCLANTSNDGVGIVCFCKPITSDMAGLIASLSGTWPITPPSRFFTSLDSSVSVFYSNMFVFLSASLQILQRDECPGGDGHRVVNDVTDTPDERLMPLHTQPVMSWHDGLYVRG